MTTLIEAATNAASALMRIDQWLKVRTEGIGLMPAERRVLEDLKQAIEREKATVKESLTDQSCETCKHDSVPRVGRCYSCQSGMTGELRNWEPKP